MDAFGPAAGIASIRVFPVWLEGMVEMAFKPSPTM